MTDLLTLDELADRLRVSRRTVEREIAAGRLRKTKVGHGTRVTEKDFEAYVAAQTRRAA